VSESTTWTVVGGRLDRFRCLGAAIEGVEIFVGELHQRLLDDRAGRVDDDVRAPVPSDDTLEQRVDLGGDPRVRSNRLGLHSVFLEDREGLAGDLPGTVDAYRQAMLAAGLPEPQHPSALVRPPTATH
jgi:hypothetical protein